MWDVFRNIINRDASFWRYEIIVPSDWDSWILEYVFGKNAKNEHIDLKQQAM